MSENDSQKRIQTQYAEVASKKDSASSGSEERSGSLYYAMSIGYSEEELKSVPEEAAVTHGCGNPAALAELTAEETVLDLGCGGGLDVFLAARSVGPRGRVIGLDMTPEMIAKARENAEKGNYTNVEFKVAKIEELPVPDNSVDVVISNCVINHARDKSTVFREVHRVLRPGGRMLVSDLVTTVDFPAEVLRGADPLWAEWLALAWTRDAYLTAVREAGFQTVAIISEGPFPISEADSLLKGKIISLHVKGVKPSSVHFVSAVQ